VFACGKEITPWCELEGVRVDEVEDCLARKGAPARRRDAVGHRLEEPWIDECTCPLVG
jgi:hypothetical protein